MFNVETDPEDATTFAVTLAFLPIIFELVSIRSIVTFAVSPEVLPTIVPPGAKSVNRLVLLTFRTEVLDPVFILPLASVAEVSGAEFLISVILFDVDPSKRNILKALSTALTVALPAPLVTDAPLTTNEPVALLIIRVVVFDVTIVPVTEPWVAVAPGLNPVLVDTVSFDAVIVFENDPVLLVKTVV